MNWWKRLVFSIISLIWGFISLDYLYLAFGLLIGDRTGTGSFHVRQEFLMKLEGIGLFLIWFLIMAVYTLFLRSISPQIDLIEEDYNTGERKIKRKWFDVILQYMFVISGLLLRWAYLCLIYFPKWTI